MSERNPDSRYSTAGFESWHTAMLSYCERHGIDLGPPLTEEEKARAVKLIMIGRSVAEVVQEID